MSEQNLQISLNDLETLTLEQLVLVKATLLALIAQVDHYIEEKDYEGIYSSESS